MSLVNEPDVIREFLIESNENLNRLDQEIVELEKRPNDVDLVSSIFRTFHTIKGSCGFLGFSQLEGVTHHAENLLTQVRAGEKTLAGTLVALVLETVDSIRHILVEIEKTGADSLADWSDLVNRLNAACDARAISTDTAAAETAPPASEKTSAAADSSIRIDVGLLDKLMNLVGELVLARNQVLQFTNVREDSDLNATSQRLNLITTELQENVMKTRMQPIGVVWNKLPRIVRDLAHSCGKQIRLEMDGSETELDKTLIEAIKDPITHLVRNCCDHGIERPEDRARSGKPTQGTIRLKAYHEGGQVNIEITDDGGGIDHMAVKQKAVEKGLIRAEEAERMAPRAAIQLILLPGVSTARAITSVSGRGVGMDVVRSNIEKIGGMVDIASTPGEGTTFKLKIPLTLAIIPGLVVTSGGERFLIPQASLVELIRLDADSTGRIEHVHGTPVSRRRGRLLPVAFLNEVLELPAAAQDDVVNMVVLQVEEHQFGLVVDGIQDTQEIVVKPLGKQLKGLPVYAGATIMGDGRVALILDVLGIGHRSGVLAVRADQSHEEIAEGHAREERQRLLLFQSGSFDRVAVPLALVARLEEFPQSMLERAGGHSVAQYRGGILNLVSLTTLLEPGTPDTAASADPVQVIVFVDGSRSLGVLVDRILDIAEEDVVIRQAGLRGGLLGSAVIGKQVTDFLDVRAVIQAAGHGWLETNTGARRSVLVADPSPFFRNLMRSELEMAGYRVIEAASAVEAAGHIEQNGVDALVASVALSRAGGTALCDAIRRTRKSIPAIALGACSGETPPEGFDACPAATDREAILLSLVRLCEATNAGAESRKDREGVQA